MSNQRTFASMAWRAKGKITRRERFLPELSHGEERAVFGDQAYWKEDDRKLLAA